MAGYYSAYFLLWLGARGRGLGFGDVKLAGVLGLYLGYLGWRSFAIGALTPSFLGGAFAIGLLVLRRANRKTAIAYGPFLIAGALIGVFVGEPLARAWLGT
jgi:leader peptidase (prepilin peptidase)/N-methyltransferase